MNVKKYLIFSISKAAIYKNVVKAETCWLWTKLYIWNKGAKAAAFKWMCIYFVLSWTFFFLISNEFECCQNRDTFWMNTELTAGQHPIHLHYMQLMQITMLHSANSKMLFTYCALESMCFKCCLHCTGAIKLHKLLLKCSQGQKNFSPCSNFATSLRCQCQNC